MSAKKMTGQKRPLNETLPTAHNPVQRSTKYDESSTRSLDVLARVAAMIEQNSVEAAKKPILAESKVQEPEMAQSKAKMSDKTASEKAVAKEKTTALTSYEDPVDIRRSAMAQKETKLKESVILHKKTRERLKIIFDEYESAVRLAALNPKIQTPEPVHTLVGQRKEDLSEYMLGCGVFSHSDGFAMGINRFLDEAQTRNRINDLIIEHDNLNRRVASDPKMPQQAQIHTIVGLTEEVFSNYMRRGPDFRYLNFTAINKRLDEVHKKRCDVQRTYQMLIHFKNQYDTRVAAGKPVPGAWYDMLGLDETFLLEFMQGYHQAQYVKVYQAMKALKERGEAAKAEATLPK